MKNDHTNIQYNGLKLALRMIKFLFKNGRAIIDKILNKISPIPRSLFVTERNIAYIGKKYHLGLYGTE